MAFTTLTMFQLFNVFNARSDETSAFKGLFTNHWLWAGVTLSIALHLAVIYTPFLQLAFSTTSLSSGDWLRCGVVASSVLWLSELSKAVIRVRENASIQSEWKALHSEWSARRHPAAPDARSTETSQRRPSKRPGPAVGHRPGACLSSHWRASRDRIFGPRSVLLSGSARSFHHTQRLSP